MPAIAPLRRALALVIALLACLAVATPAYAADTRPPTVPTLLKAAPAAQAVTLTWKPATDDVGVKYYLTTLAGQVKKPTAAKVWFGNLKPATTYTATVRAVDAAGNKSAPVSISVRTLAAAGDTTAPSVPAGLTATPDRTGASLTWTAATDNTGVTGYRVAVTGQTATQTVTATTATLAGLTPLSTYTATVVALDAAGNASAPASVTFTTLAPPDTTAPTPPAALTATPAQTGASLTWTAATDNTGVTGYRVAVTGQTATQTVTSTATTLAGLTPLSTYTATVVALDAAGNTSPPATVTFTTLAPPDTTAPSTPGGLTATPAQTGASLTWTAATDNTGVTGYRVAVTGQTATQTVTSTATTLAGLTPLSTYTATVVALDAAGNTSPPATVTFTTLAPPDTTAPDTPADLAATPSHSGAGLTWTAATDDVAVTGYTVAVTGQTGTQTVTGTAAALTGLTPLTTYTATVTAADAAGNASAPASVTFTTLAPPDTAPPTAPTGFIFVPGETTVELNWQASQDNVAVTGYTIAAGGQTFTATTPTVTLTGLPQATTMTATVYASDAAGNNSATVPTNIRTTTSPDTQAPSAPQLRAVAGTNRVSLTVGGSSDDRAVVRYTVSLGGVTQTATEPTTLLFTGLTPSRTYTAVATARDAAGNASPSSTLAVTTRTEGVAPDTQAPDQPRDFTARAGSTAASFRWEASADDIDVNHYTLTVAGTTQDVTTPMAFVDSLDPDTSYDASLVAVDTAGNRSTPATLSLRTSALDEGLGLHGTIAWFGRSASQASMDEALASSLVDGISVFARWNEVTTDGVSFDYTPFDRARIAAGRAGKPWAGMVIYGVIGNGIPDYVSAGLPADEIVTADGMARPVFWSASAQAAARGINTALANRYGSDRNLAQWRVNGLWAVNGEPWFLGGAPGRQAYLAAYQVSHPGATFADLQSAYNGYEKQIWAEAAAAWPARIQLAQAAGDAVGDVAGTLAIDDPNRHPQRLATWSAIRAELGPRMVGQFNGVNAGVGASGYGAWLATAFGPSGRYPGRIGSQPIGGVTSSDIRLTAADFREMTRLLTVRGYSYSEFYAADVLYAIRGQTEEARHVRDTLMTYQGSWAP